MGPYEYNKWSGVAICIDETEDYGDEIAYGFQISDNPHDLAFFIDEDIIAESL